MEDHASDFLKKHGERTLDEAICDEAIIPVYQIVSILVLNTLLSFVDVNVLHGVVQVIGQD